MLLVESREIWHQVLHDWHVWEGVDLERGEREVNREAGKRITLTFSPEIESVIL